MAFGHHQAIHSEGKLSCMTTTNDAQSNEAWLENLDDQPLKRMAIVDTCNVMYAGASMSWDHDAITRKRHGDNREQRGRADAVAVMVLVNQLLSEAFDVRLFVPQNYMSGGLTDHVFILKVLDDLGLLTSINDGTQDTEGDDLVILEMAKMMGGFAISNDRYRNHISKSLHRTITERNCGIGVNIIDYKDDHEVIAATVGNVKNKFYPGMEIVLRPDSFSTMFALPQDPTYNTVFQMRAARSQKLALKAIKEMNVCADYIQRLACFRHGVMPPVLDYLDSQDQMSFADFHSSYSEWQSWQGGGM